MQGAFGRFGLGGSRWGTVFDRFRSPLGRRTPLGEGFCLEIPSDYAASAAIAVLITTQHIAVQCLHGWMAHLGARLTAAADDALAGDLDPLARAFRILQKRAPADPASCGPIIAALKAQLPKPLLRRLRREGFAGSGRRFDRDLLADYDLVAAKRAKDVLYDIGHLVVDSDGLPDVNYILP